VVGNMTSEHWKKYLSYLEPRIDKLFENKFYLEIILYFSALLERELKDLIEIYEKLIPKRIVEKNNKVQFKPEKYINKEQLTLGKLNEYLSVYCPDKNILREINQFVNLRNKIIHKIFNENENFQELELQAITWTSRFYKLMEQLTDIEMYLTQKIKI